MSGLFGEAINRPARKSVEWYTPKWIFDELAIDFDLDPSSPWDFKTFVPAAQKFTVFDDGLAQQWHGRIWLNPPYGPDTGFWMRRFIDHGNGIALVFSRTDAEWCQEAMKTCSAMLFLSGRVAFVPGEENRHKVGRAGAGTAMFAFGDECATALFRMRDRGVFVSKSEVVA